MPAQGYQYRIDIISNLELRRGHITSMTYPEKEACHVYVYVRRGVSDKQ